MNILAKFKHKTNIDNSYNKINRKFLNEEYLNFYERLEKTFNYEKNLYNCWACPNCGVIYDKPIKSTRICKYCQKKITKRRNYLTKKAFLIGEKNLAQYSKFEEELGLLHFYENILVKKSYSIKNLNSIIANYRKRPGIVTPRDLLWCLCNDYFMEYQHLALNEFKKSINIKDTLDKITAIIETQKLFHIAYSFLDSSINILEREEKYDILCNLIGTYIHAQMSINLLYYTANKYAQLDEKALMQCAYNLNLENLITAKRLTINEYEKIYKENTRDFIIPIISINDSWEIVKTMLLNRNFK